MVSDVQSWLDNPATNYGWALIGDESTKTTARRFASREGVSQPALVVDFTPSGEVEACCESSGECSLTSVGACSNTPLPGVDSCEPNQCPQPVGACCNADNTCSDDNPISCEDGGGEFVGGQLGAPSVNTTINGRAASLRGNEVICWVPFKMPSAIFVGVN